MSVTQLYLTLWDPVDCSPSDSYVHGILHTRILEWIAILLQGIFLTQGLNLGLLHCRQILYHLRYQGSCPNCQAKVNKLLVKVYFTAVDNQNLPVYKLMGAQQAGFQNKLGINFDFPLLSLCCNILIIMSTK